MANEHVITLSTANFEQEVSKSTTPVLVDFWATWCGPCKMIGPLLDELAEENAGKIKVGKVNVDEANDLAGRYGVQSIPTVLLFVGGQVVQQMIGAKHKRDYKAAIDGQLPK